MANTLDPLPNELQSLILHEIPEGSIPNLLHSVPSFRRLYLAERDLILKDMDKRLLVEIFAMYEAADVRAHRVTYDEKRQYLIAFLTRLDQEEVRDTLPQIFSIVRLRSMLEFHTTTQILVDDFLKWAWSRSSPFPRIPAARFQNNPLSSQENLRLFRAFYGVQLYCNLYGIPMNYCETPLIKRVRPGGRAWQMFIRPEHSDERASMFLSRFPEWEVEEIACIKDYMTSRYTDFLAECETDLPRDSARSKEARELAPSVPIHSFNVSPTVYDYDTCRNHLIAFGIPFLVNMLRTQSHEARVDLIDEGLQSRNGVSLNENLEMGREGLEPVDGYAAYEVVRKERQPSPAWARIDGQRKGLEANDLERAALRRWGYIMWDDLRLDIAGLKLNHGLD